MTMQQANRFKPPLELFFPLDEFYTAEGRPFPQIVRIEGEDMPQPYRDLLVHTGDMTPTLEAFHGSSIHLRLFDKKLNGGRHMSRRVALVLDSNETPVEFGAITIHLGLFSEQAKRHILECRKPLGTIFAEDGIDHESRPVSFFRVKSDDLINETLGLTGEHTLYGRQNIHYNEDGEPLAEVIEILPPIMEPAG